ncbi:MAG TPA: IniB N-terminal domain-containing protein, partial [Mycobacterium sp.]
MNQLIQYILDLFSNPAAAQAFLAGPGQAMTDAGLVNVSPDEFSSAVTGAVPGVDLPPGDPIGGLQQVLADQYGYDPGYGGYDPGYGGYDGGYGGYGTGPIAAVAEDGAALVADAVAP